MVRDEISPTTVRAVVRALEGTRALVEVEQGGCGRCHEEGGCGGQHLTQMFCGGPRTYYADNDIGAIVGDPVVVAIAAGSVRQSANLAYILPLTVSIGGAMLGSVNHGNLGAMIGAGVGLVVAFVLIRLRSPSKQFDAASRPHIISRS